MQMYTLLAVCAMCEPQQEAFLFYIHMDEGPHASGMQQHHPSIAQGTAVTRCHRLTMSKKATIEIKHLTK